MSIPYSPIITALHWSVNTFVTPYTCVMYVTFAMKKERDSAQECAYHHDISVWVLKRFLIVENQENQAYNSSYVMGYNKL